MQGAYRTPYFTYLGSLAHFLRHGERQEARTTGQSFRNWEELSSVQGDDYPEGWGALADTGALRPEDHACRIRDPPPRPTCFWAMAPKT